MGSVYIRAERAGPEKVWHPGCFKCATCEELLVDLIYYHSPEKASLYCGRHHAELVGVRCTACDEVCLIDMPHIVVCLIGHCKSQNLKLMALYLHI